MGNALIEEMNDVRRRITPIEEEIEHLKQELAVAKSQPRVTKNNQNATLRAELAELTAARAQVEKLEMKLAALSKELIEKICDPKLPLGSSELQDLRWQIIQTKEGIEHFKQELEELTSQPRVTKNNQAPGPSRPRPVCPEPLMAE